MTQEEWNGYVSEATDAVRNLLVRDRDLAVLRSLSELKPQESGCEPCLVVEVPGPREEVG